MGGHLKPDIHLVRCRLSLMLFSVIEQADGALWALIALFFPRNYVTAFNAYIQPFPNWYVLGPNIQYLLRTVYMEYLYVEFACKYLCVC